MMMMMSYLPVSAAEPAMAIYHGCVGKPRSRGITAVINTSFTDTV